MDERAIDLRCNDCGTELENTPHPDSPNIFIVSPCWRCMALANEKGLKGEKLDLTPRNPETWERYKGLPKKIMTTEQLTGHDVSGP